MAGTGSESSYDDHVRAAFSEVPGQNVLDCTPRNIFTFAQGRLGLLKRDFFAVLPSKLAEDAMRACAEEGLAAAFALRRELCNFKKVFLNLFDLVRGLEKDLRRLCAFFFKEVIEFRTLAPEQLTTAAAAAAAASQQREEGQLSEKEAPDDTRAPFRHAARYSELCSALQRCKGVLNATHDVRDVVKGICCLPRHPDAPPDKEAGASEAPGAAELPRTIRALPWSLLCAKSLRQAGKFLAEHGGDASTAELTWERPAPQNGAGRLAFEAVLGRLRKVWGEGRDGELRFVRAVLVARGAAKALWMASETRHWVEIQRELPRALEEALRAVRELPKLAPDSLSVPIHVDKFTQSFEGALSILREDARWVPAMLEHADRIAAADAAADDGVEAPGACEPLFVAGDAVLGGNSAMWLPAGFATEALSAFLACRRVAERYTLEMEAELDSGARRWPPHDEGCTEDPAAGAPEEQRQKQRGRRKQQLGRRPCATCGHRFSNIWIHRGVCSRCESSARKAGRCAFRPAKCGARWWCTHARRCFVCDLWSCEACRLSRADGEDTLALVERLRPAAVFLDFDRTLASTRNGGNPLQRISGAGGRSAAHSVDAGLAAVCSNHANVHVVTRNSHKAEIEAFLEARGCRVRAVHSVPQRIGNKADVVVEVCLAVRAATEGEGGGPIEALFVDDDIAEHAKMAADPRICVDDKMHSGVEVSLHRVLFARGIK